jgi:hypothetical protein
VIFSDRVAGGCVRAVRGVEAGAQFPVGGAGAEDREFNAKQAAVAISRLFPEPCVVADGVLHVQFDQPGTGSISACSMKKAEPSGWKNLKGKRRYG